ncbi:MAG TPA: DUF72 domain-containing protein [Polyangiaceae bacterium]|nr:DUF72 domain-containing protein [Polyangiaceae bacterium]
MTGHRQPDLFELPPKEIEPFAATPEQVSLGTKLSRGIRLGTMSWSFPGWTGIVYGGKPSPNQLADIGLTAYARHPVLRTVEIDRTYYEPLPRDAFATFAAQTPDDFRFVVKAHEDCTVRRFPAHPRYGKKRERVNALFLDPAYAIDAVVAPLLEGLGAKLGVLLFQFPPQDVNEAPGAFAERLHSFLIRLPKGVVYAVELRNVELFTPSYVAAITDAGATHCHNIWPGMPPLVAQVRRVPPPARRPLVVRWLLRAGDAYEEARDRYAPFDRVVDEDLRARSSIAAMAERANLHGVSVFILINNKAEGCAPESAVRLARAIVESTHDAPLRSV